MEDLPHCHGKLILEQFSHFRLICIRRFFPDIHEVSKLASLGSFAKSEYKIYLYLRGPRLLTN